MAQPPRKPRHAKLRKANRTSGSARPSVRSTATAKPTRTAGLRAFSLTSALLNAMLIWWRSEQRILLRPDDLDRSRFYRDTLGLAITPAEAQDSARPRSMAAYAVAAGRDGLGEGDAVPREAAGRLERGAPLAGDEGPADPGHPQRPAVGGQQVQIARNARSGIAFASRTPQCAPTTPPDPLR